MEFHRYAIGWHKNAVALKEIQHDVFSEEHTAAIHAQQSMEAVAPGLESGHLSILGVQ